MKSKPKTDKSNAAAGKSATRLDLSTWILLGLIAGVACGLFFGEYCAPLAIIGDAFVGLLRMTVLPFIAVSLIANLGRLTLAETSRLAWIGGLTLVVLWSASLVTVFCLQFAFPDWNSGSFFSSALIEPPAESSLLAYFIPTNVFESLATNQVPAIVVFCIASGLALATLKDRQQLISQLDVLSKVLLKISVFITKLAPLGVFAISASISGTVSLNEVVRLQTYLLTYTFGAVFLGFVVLPWFVTLATPLTYRQAFRVAKEPMLTAFATGKLIIVLPMLIRNTERLFQELDVNGDRRSAPAIDVLYATAYPFPHVGKLLSLLFIPFAAWFIGDAMQWHEYPRLFSIGVFSYFGGPIVAIPFLLDQMQLPHDMLQLFVLSGVYGERVGDALGAMHLTAFSLISAFGFRSELKIKWGSAFRQLVFVVLVGGLTIAGMRFWLDQSVGQVEDRNIVLTRMQLIERPVNSMVLNVPAPNPDELQPGESLLQRIRRRQAIRVGFNEDKLPFAFFNGNGDLVGYDINMVHALARDLAVTIEFVPFARDTLVEQLEADHFDVVMSGLVGTLERSEAMQHTESYVDVNLALVVPDYRARSFKTLGAIKSISPLRIGFVDLSRGFVDRLRVAIPRAELIEIKNNRDYFTGETVNLDALLISAESGSAFTLNYPDYEVVVPSDLKVKLPLFYVIGQQDSEMRDFLEHWVTLRKKDGTAAEYYDHWVLGKTRTATTRRWSIIRDELGWVD
jgi:Na+/H+-dicarboxylate symporter/ABC-type amino acid transport substrate-binding protein